MGSLGGGQIKNNPKRLRPSQVSGMCPGGARKKMEFHKPVNISCVLPDGLTPGQEGPQARSCCPDRPEECLTQRVIRTDQLGRTQSRTRDSRAWTGSFLTCTHSVVSSPPQALGHARSPLLCGLAPHPHHGLSPHHSRPLCTLVTSPTAASTKDPH